MKTGGRDTSIGGPWRPFQTTIWSEVLSAGDPDHPRYKEGLDRLLRNYWKPVYAYIRSGWGKSVEDAKDLTQAFLVHLMENGRLGRPRPERGSFRAYLKVALKHFLINAERDVSLRKPKSPLFPLDPVEDGLDPRAPVASGDSPERAYDRQWFSCLLNASIESLKEALAKDGKEQYFQVLKAYAVDPLMPAPSGDLKELGTIPDALGVPTYAQVALELGIKESDVRNYLSYCRRLLREIMRERIREYAEDVASVDGEFEDFFRL